MQRQTKLAKHCHALTVAVVVGFASLCSGHEATAREQPQDQARWVPLFNGKDLNGWIPKINHRALGDNYLDTFVAHDGVLHISYDKYSKFTDEFAHLIYRQPFSNYRLRMDYRFVGTDTPGGPPWASRNSGVMIHGQTPETIGVDQPFPVSVEAQLLNGAGTEQRSTGNVCTPGTVVDIAGAAIGTHCRNSTSRTYTGEQWVHFEIEVRGGRKVTHIVDGKVVLEYEHLQLDPTDLRAMEIYLKSGLSTKLDRGYISLQGEGHPIDFRNIEILELDE